jgi:hypothetical protein
MVKILFRFNKYMFFRHGMVYSRPVSAGWRTNTACFVFKNFKKLKIFVQLCYVRWARFFAFAMLISDPASTLHS